MIVFSSEQAFFFFTILFLSLILNPQLTYIYFFPIAPWLNSIDKYLFAPNIFMKSYLFIIFR